MMQTIFEFNAHEVIKLAITLIASITHIFTAILGFSVSRYHQPIRWLFTLAILLLGWSTITLGFAFGGLGRYYPWLLYLSPMLSGYLLPAYYLYVRSVIYPKTNSSLAILLFGLPGTVYALVGLSTEQGIAFAQGYILEQHATPAFNSVMHSLFIMHSLEMLVFSLLTSWIIVRSYVRSRNSAYRSTLAWLLGAIIISWLILLSTNFLPLLGIMVLAPFLPLLTILISTLSYRSLLSHTDRMLMTKTTEQEFHKDKMESIGRVAKGIAHDINNMLSGIVGHAELGEIQINDSEKLKKHLSQIKAISLRAGKLHNQLLTFSGKGIRNHELETDILGPIQDAISILEPQLHPAIQIAIDIPDYLPAVPVKAQDIHRAILNLLINSKEAMEGRDGTISITARYEENAMISPYSIGAELDGSATIYIEIKDEGVGIPEAIRSKILEPFFTTKKTGQGMGLLNVLSMIRETNGALSIQSTEGKGATFELWLPLAQSVSPKQVPTKRVVLEEQRILVVDDDEMVLNAIHERFTFLQVKVTTAKSGKEAIQLVQQQAFDHVLLDVRMDAMNGLETAQILINQHHIRNITLMSGDEDGPEIERLIGEKNIRFIRKPIGIEDLKNILST